MLSISGLDIGLNLKDSGHVHPLIDMVNRIREAFNARRSKRPFDELRELCENSLFGAKHYGVHVRGKLLALYNSRQLVAQLISAWVVKYYCEFTQLLIAVVFDRPGSKLKVAVIGRIIVGQNDERETGAR